VRIPEKVALLEKRGWYILDKVADEEKWMEVLYSQDLDYTIGKKWRHSIPCTRFSLSRGELPPVLTAADPMPYTSMGGPYALTNVKGPSS
jgi:hypothetical protein